MVGKSGVCLAVLLFLPLVVFADVPDTSGVRESDDTRRKYIVHTQGMYEGQSIRFRTRSMFKTRKSGLFEEITSDGIRASVLVNRFPGNRESLLIPYSELESLEIYVGAKDARVLGGFFKGAFIGSLSGVVVGFVIGQLEKTEQDDPFRGLAAVVAPIGLGIGGFVIGGCTGAMIRYIAADRAGWRHIPIMSADRPSPVSRPLSIAFAWKF